jgi:hypothetical protein
MFEFGVLSHGTKFIVNSKKIQPTILDLLNAANIKLVIRVRRCSRVMASSTFVLASVEN